MNEEELKQIGLSEELLDGIDWFDPGDPTKNHGCREDWLQFIPYDLVKEVYKLGGVESVDQLLRSNFYAMSATSDLIRVVDKLFLSENRDNHVETALKEFIESITLPLHDCECHINYDKDPHDRADSELEAFSYSLADNLEAIIN